MALVDLYGIGYVPVYVEEPGVRFSLRKKVHDISSCTRALVMGLAGMLSVGIVLYT